MAIARLEFEERQQPRKDVFDVVRLEPDIDDAGRCGRSLQKDEFAKIAVARNEKAIVGDRIRENDFVFLVGQNNGCTYDIVSGRTQNASDAATDVRIAHQLQAARARPIAT
ncbi:hypothetical protein U1708_14940 [Sphingomonas sp. ZB1N12]